MHPRNSIAGRDRGSPQDKLDNKDTGAKGSVEQWFKVNHKRSHWWELLVRIFYMMEIGDNAGSGVQGCYRCWGRAENVAWGVSRLGRREKYLGVCSIEGKGNWLIVHLPLGYYSCFPGFDALPQSLGKFQGRSSWLVKSLLSPVKSRAVERWALTCSHAIICCTVGIYVYPICLGSQYLSPISQLRAAQVYFPMPLEPQPTPEKHQYCIL